MSETRIWRRRLAVLLLTAGLAVPLTLSLAILPVGAAHAAVRSSSADEQTQAPAGSNALQDVADRAGRYARTVALSLIGMALAVASVLLIFRRDFKEAAGIFAVGLLAVLLATPSGLNLLRNTAALIFGGQ